MNAKQGSATADLEGQLNAALDEAKANHDRADFALREARERGDEIMEQARKKRDAVLAEATAQERATRDELRRLERMLKLYRNEPLIASSPKPNGEVPSEVVDQVYAAAVKLAEADPDDAFVRNGIYEATDGVGPDMIDRALQVLRTEEKVRRAGKRRNGQLWKLWAAS